MERLMNDSRRDMFEAFPMLEIEETTVPSRRLNSQRQKKEDNQLQRVEEDPFDLTKMFEDFDKRFEALESAMFGTPKRQKVEQNKSIKASETPKESPKQMKQSE